MITVSDTRTLEQDRSGDALVYGLQEHGHEITTRRLVADSVDEIRKVVELAVARDDVDAVILTGGTGVTPRDVTPEAVEPLFDCAIPGFGELFRQLSFEAIGPRAVLSRATAGVIGETFVFALPGSTGACRQAVDQIIGPLLGHAVAMSHWGTRRT